MKRTTDATLRDSTLPVGYPEFIAELKARIRSAQVRAVVSVNRESVSYTHLTLPTNREV